MLMRLNTPLDKETFHKLEAVIEEMTILCEAARAKSERLTAKLQCLGESLNGCYSQTDFLYRDLSHDEKKQLCDWAHRNWCPDTKPNPLWHPCVLDVWNKLDNCYNG